MSPVIPQQHPAVVLRSRYDHVRTGLIAAIVAVVLLAGAVIALAIEGDDGGAPAGARALPSAVATPHPAPGRLHLAGHPEEGTRGAVAATRLDGGPEEGTAGR